MHTGHDNKIWVLFVWFSLFFCWFLCIFLPTFNLEQYSITFRDIRFGFSGFTLHQHKTGHTVPNIHLKVCIFCRLSIIWNTYRSEHELMAWWWTVGFILCYASTILGLSPLESGTTSTVAVALLLPWERRMINHTWERKC